MKLIIEIPDDRYKDVIEARKHHLLDSYAQAVANGTPIDDDSLLAALMLFAMDNVTPQSKAQIKEKLLQILDGKGEYDALQNGTPIPDNATNGDVIKAMFPNGTTAKFATFMRFIDGEHYFNCSEEWWNAPYQNGDKE